MERTFLQGERVVHVTAWREGQRLGIETATGAPEFTWEELAPGDYLVRSGAVLRRCFVARLGAERWVWIDGRVHHLKVVTGSPRQEEHHTGDLEAPMPGQVLEILVQPGEHVVRHQPLVLMEAMKMQVEIVATRDGTVAEVRARAGEQVQGGAVLVVLEVDGKT